MSQASAAVELAQVASMGAEIAEVASTTFIITLVVRQPLAPPAVHAQLTRTRRVCQGLAIGFVLLRVESVVEGDAE